MIFSVAAEYARRKLLKECDPYRSSLQKQSDRRDLNPRPVAAAPALRIQPIEFIATSSCFVIPLLSSGFGPVGKVLSVQQSPWNAVARRFGVTGIMPPETVSEVLT